MRRYHQEERLIGVLVLLQKLYRVVGHPLGFVAGIRLRLRRIPVIGSVAKSHVKIKRCPVLETQSTSIGRNEFRFLNRWRVRTLLRFQHRMMSDDARSQVPLANESCVIASFIENIGNAALTPDVD